MYDILKDMLPKFSDETFYSSVMNELGLSLEDYAVLTFHRRENVDDFDRLSSAMKAFEQLDRTILFPMHPRTKQKLIEMNTDLGKNIIVLDPLPYSWMMSLVSKASLLLTDSGGLQKEAYLLNTPCVTIRDNTEWIETLESGANVLSSHSIQDITSKAERMWAKKLKNDASVYGDGNASERIVSILRNEDLSIKRNSML